MKAGSYGTSYPLFESLIKKVIINMDRRIPLTKISTNELLFLTKCKNILWELMTLFRSMPSISNVNLETIANDLKGTDSSIEVIHLKLELKKSPNLLRIGIANIKIY